VIRSSIANSFTSSLDASSDSVPDEHEEYVVHLKRLNISDEYSPDFGVHGVGVGTSGRSSGGRVEISGCIRGSTLTLIEEWHDDGSLALPSFSQAMTSTTSCLIEAHLSVDGRRFEGSYRNMENGSIGKVAGVCEPDSDSFHGGNLDTDSRRAVETSILLAQAASRLAANVSLGSSAEDILDECCKDCERPSKATQELLSSSMILAKGKSSLTDKDISFVRNLYAAPTFVGRDCQHISSCWEEAAFSPLLESKTSMEELIENPRILVTEAVDDSVSAEAGGKGSLSVLAPAPYQSARLGVVSVLLHHVGGSIDLSSLTEGGEIATEALLLWRQALQITEAGVRGAISDDSPFVGNRKEKCQSYCELSILVSDFLLKFPAYCPGGYDHSQKEEFEAISSDIGTIYSAIRRVEDMKELEIQMDYLTKLGISRCVSYTCLSLLLAKVQCVPSVEAIVASLPRLMKAGAESLSSASIDSTRNTSNPSLLLNGAESKQFPCVGTHFLSRLQGCSSTVQNVVRSQVYEVYSATGRAFAEALAKPNKEKNAFAAMSQSLCLSVVGALLSTIGPEDVSAVVEKSGLFESLPSVFSLYRESITNSYEPKEESHRAERDTRSCVEKLLQSLNISSIRHVAQSSISLLHSIAYQLSAMDSLEQNALVSDFLELLCAHTQEVVRALSEAESISRTMASSAIALADWEKWTEVCNGDSIVPTIMSKEEKTPDHLRSLALAQRSIELGSSSQSRQNSTIALASSRTSIHHLLLTQQAHSCINVFCTMARSSGFVQSLSKDEGKMGMLLRLSGLSSPSADIDSTGHVVPILIRIRVTRLLMRLLPFRDPDEAVILGFFRLLASSSWKSPNDVDIDDGNNTSKECAALAINSLLRHLYSSSGPYKSAIDGAIKKASGRDNVDIEGLKRGILAFWGGLPGRVSEGSFVLLKPPTAAALSSNSSIIKSSNYGGAPPTAPLVVGSEAVVAGICRRDAMAGVVTGIDTANGTCEVVLFDRKPVLDANVTRLPSQSVSDTSSKQSSMTVRAVRAQLSDVVSAEEMPLLIDSRFDFNELVGAPLNEAMAFLSSFLSNDCDQESVSVQDLESAILSIRASIVLLSDKGILRRFVDQDVSSRRLLSQLLEFASTKPGQGPFDQSNLAFGEIISETPEHEARYLYLRRIWLETTARRRCFHSKPLSEWEELLQDSQSHVKKKADSNAEGTHISGEYSTPAIRPAAPSTSSFARRALSEETTTSSRGSEATEQTANRGTSARRSTSRADDEGGDDDDEDDDQDEEEEEAIVQMAELGLPRSWAELALRRVGGTNIEAAVHFCLERGADMERLLEEERERERRQASESGTRRRNTGGAGRTTSYLLQQLVEMGFPARWCAEALAATGTSSVDEALTWILANGERLSAQDTNDDDDNGELMEVPAHIRPYVIGREYGIASVNFLHPIAASFFLSPFSTCSAQMIR
jgi:hypothetical protein